MLRSLWVRLGGAPAVEGQVLNATVTARSLMQTPEQFSNIFLKNTTSGAQVRLGDVARVELGAGRLISLIRNLTVNQLVVWQLNLPAGANALDTAQAVEERLSGYVQLSARHGRPTGF